MPSQIEQIRFVWRLAPVGLRTLMWRAVNFVVDQINWARTTGFTPARRPSDPAEPLVVAGFFRSASGLGEAARSTVRSLRAAGLSPLLLDLTTHFVAADLESDLQFSMMPTGTPGTIILHVNAPQAPRALNLIGRRVLSGWRIVGYWAWELPVLPKRWAKAGRLVSEIWTLCRFAEEAIRAGVSSVPVRSFPVAVVPPGPEQDLSEGRAFPGADFTVLTLADALSSLDRKNPMGAIEAFKRAFGARTDCLLIVKVRNLHRFPGAAEILRTSIGAAANIRILDCDLSERDKWRLIAACDVLISLHRAEGFGLSIAEAMSLGIPTIATGWSGNMEFSTAESCCLTNFELVPIEDPYGVYPKMKTCWAAPDIGMAALHLRALQEDEGLRQRTGETARAIVSGKLSAARIGASMKAALYERSRGG